MISRGFTGPSDQFLLPSDDGCEWMQLKDLLSLVTLFRIGAETIWFQRDQNPWEIKRKMERTNRIEANLLQGESIQIKHLKKIPKHFKSPSCRGSCPTSIVFSAQEFRMVDSLGNSQGNRQWLLKNAGAKKTMCEHIMGVSFDSFLMHHWYVAAGGQVLAPVNGIYPWII